MGFREKIINYSRGDNLQLFWRLFYMRKRTKNTLMKSALAFWCSRLAQKHGGYLGVGAEVEKRPSLPHGLHGIYISRYASIGAGCRIYQNVTLGEIEQKAPKIGKNCLIGAGAVLVGDITIGENVKIGAGAVVFTDIPDNSTVVSQPPRILTKELEGSSIC